MHIFCHRLAYTKIYDPTRKSLLAFALSVIKISNGIIKFSASAKRGGDVCFFEGARESFIAPNSRKGRSSKVHREEWRFDTSLERDNNIPEKLFPPGELFRL